MSLQAPFGILAQHGEHSHTMAALGGGVNQLAPPILLKKPWQAPEKVSVDTMILMGTMLRSSALESL